LLEWIIERGHKAGLPSWFYGVRIRRLLFPAWNQNGGGKMETPDRQLRCFACIAQWKSLSRAAEELDRSQSWLSKQLAMLETSVGKPLFVRTGRGVELTEAGQKLFDAIQEPYRDIDRAFGEVSHVQGVTQGTVRLAVIHTLSYYFMAEVIARFIGIHPRVNLSLLGRSS